MLKTAKTDPAFSDIEDIIADVRDGKMVVVVDDEDRENEGDLIMAANRVRTEDVNFMARYGRGLICVTLSQERCRQLRLPLMVDETDSQQGTNFTVSIEAAVGEPPISRWVYADFVVFFEYDRVIHAVIKR